MMTHDLPDAIQAVTQNTTMLPITVGMSGDAVYKIEADAQYYLKIGHSLQAEYERLQWLQNKLPVPEVVHYEIHGGKHYLLTSAIEGVMLFRTKFAIERCIDIMAEGARLWHSIDKKDCPFDFTLQKQIEAARHKLDNHQLKSEDFHSQFYGKSAQELFVDLLNAIPEDADNDLVLTHGDYCLPNILVNHQGDITGFVDVGEVGISDRHLDLTLGSRSIQYNFGSKWITHFYNAYGIERDPAKYHFYSILNEFV